MCVVMDVTTRTTSKLEVCEFCGNATPIKKGRNTMENNNALNEQNMNENKKASTKEVAVEIETLYKCVCPNGTRKTSAGHLNGIGAKIEKAIRSGRWEAHLSQLYTQIKESKESMPWSAIDWFMDDLCGGKFPIEPTNIMRHAICSLALYVDTAIRFGKEEANARFKKAFGNIDPSKKVA